MHSVAYVSIEMGPRLLCACPLDATVREEDFCIVEADRTLEFGKIVALRQHDGEPPPNLPRIVRAATVQDRAQANENAAMSKLAADACRAKIEKYGLQMRLEQVRYSFDRSVLHVMYSAEGRVDYAEAVKELTGELSVRVEMRQMGARERARTIGGLGPCGRTLCCSWMIRLPPVSTRMVKQQGVSLMPGAISGQCGRLKCCIRFEAETRLAPAAPAGGHDEADTDESEPPRRETDV